MRLAVGDSVNNTADATSTRAADHFGAAYKGTRADRLNARRLLPAPAGLERWRCSFWDLDPSSQRRYLTSAMPPLGFIRRDGRHRH